MEVFMDRIGSGVYHSLSHFIGQNSLVHDMALFLTARESGKQSLTMCPGRSKHGVWMPGEGTVGIGPGVGDRLRWQMHPWLSSGSWLQTNSPH